MLSIARLLYGRFSLCLVIDGDEHPVEAIVWVAAAILVFALIRDHKSAFCPPSNLTEANLAHARAGLSRGGVAYLPTFV